MFKVFIVIAALQPSGKWQLVSSEEAPSMQQCIESVEKFSTNVTKEQTAPVFAGCVILVPKGRNS